VRLYTTVYGEDLINRHLLRFQYRTLNARPAFLAVGKDMFDAMEKQFDSQGSHASGGWEELELSTLAAKSRKGQDPRILHATMDMRDSLTGPGGGNIFMADDESLIFGTQDVKAIFHQSGTVNMPQRRIMEFTELEKRGFVHTLQRFIVEGELGFEGVL
jgi:phage gpG-like protein